MNKKWILFHLKEALEEIEPDRILYLAVPYTRSWGIIPGAYYTEGVKKL